MVATKQKENKKKRCLDAAGSDEADEFEPKVAAGIGCVRVWLAETAKQLDRPKTRLEGRKKKLKMQAGGCIWICIRN